MIAHRTTLAECIRFGIVGLANNIFGYLIFLFITFCGIEHKLAMTILYVSGTMFSFFGNWKWVFAHNQNFISALCRFLIVYLMGYLINLALLLHYVDQLGYSYFLVQAISILVVAAFLFIMLKLVIFKSIDKPTEGAS